MTRKRLQVIGVALAIAYACHTGTASAQVANPYNVRSHGAMGDGSTDDTAAFIATIAAIPAHGGGEVYIPAGTYRLTQTLNVTDKSIAFRGEGQRNSQLVWTGNTVSHGINFSSTSLTTNYTFEVHSLSFVRDGNQTSGAAINASWAIPADRNSYGAVTATIHDVHVGAPSTAPAGNSSFLVGIAVASANGVKISNFQLMGDFVATAGIQINGPSSNIHITDGDISQWVEGITVQAGVNDVHIDNVEAAGVYYGFHLLGGTGTSISNCHAFANTRGIEVGNATDIAIVNNLIFSGACAGDSCATPWIGIHAFASAGVTGQGRIRIIGNGIHPQYALFTTTYGILVEGALVDSTVQGNYSEGLSVGIALGPSTSGTVVVGNRIALPTAAGWVDVSGMINHFADNY